MTIERTGLAMKSVDDAPPDIYLDESGSLAVVTNAIAVGQHARQRLMTHGGEWFLDTGAGVPWLTQVHGRAYDATVIAAIGKAVVRATDGVTAVQNFATTFDKSSRVVKAGAVTVSTEYGERVIL